MEVLGATSNENIILFFLLEFFTKGVLEKSNTNAFEI